MAISHHALSCCCLTILLFVLNVAQVAHGQGPCYKSSDCPQNSGLGFCNFDLIDFGFCELCAYIRGGCKNSGLNSQKGQEECKKICEGNQSTTPPSQTTNNPNTSSNSPTIPPSSTTLAPNTCTSQISFPVTNSGISGYPHKMTVYGIPMFATSKWSTQKLNHVASVFAELLDNDEDGCVDDPTVLNRLLQAQDGKRAAVLLPNNENDAQSASSKLQAAGYFIGQLAAEDETKVECTGLGFTHSCSDASIEELFHLITSLGHAKVYASIFGADWTSNSKLTQAMDVARGGRYQNVPSTYPSSAWYSYTDSTCTYNCQAIEYIWWGYCSYSGICAGRSGNSGFEREFKYLLKSQLLTGDLKMSKLFQESGSGYVLPVKHVDGKYHGCKTCLNGANHGGN